MSPKSFESRGQDLLTSTNTAFAVGAFIHASNVDISFLEQFIVSRIAENTPDALPGYTIVRLEFSGFASSFVNLDISFDLV